MEALIRKWGNSPALRLPTTVLKEAGYHIEQKVEHRVAVLTARETDHHLVAFLDHREISDRIAHFFEQFVLGFGLSLHDLYAPVENSEFCHFERPFTTLKKH